MPTLTVKNIPNDVYERLKQKLKPTGAVLTARSSLATNILSAAKLSNRNKSWPAPAGFAKRPVNILSVSLPTRTKQADLNFVLHAGHGEFPRVIFAPGSIEEAVSFARSAFDVADRWQVPVFILTDQYLADSVQIKEGRVPAKMLRREYPVFEAGYRRYEITDDGVSPLTYPGLSEARVEVDSDEHTEDGKITENLDLRVRMVEKRLRKLDGLQKEAVMPSRFGDQKAKTILISWGSNRLIVNEAVDALRDEGIAAASVHFGQVWPFSTRLLFIGCDCLVVAGCCSFTFRLSVSSN